MVMTATRESQSRETRLDVIDCDVHNTVTSPKALTKYFPARWRSYHETFGPRRSGGRFTPQMYPGAHRVDAWPPSGVTPGSDREFLTAQLVDRYGLAYAILNPFAIGASSQVNEEYGVALSQAINDWQVADWLERDGHVYMEVPLDAGLPVEAVNKVREGRPHIVDRMLSGGVQLVFNTTEGAQAIADSFSLRRTALTHGIPYYTTVAGARAAVQAVAALRAGNLEVAPLQSYL